MKNIVFVFFSLLFLFSCNNDNTNGAEEETHANSIFQLNSKWQTQEGETIQLKDLKGKNLVVVLIFTQCQTACPLLVADMKRVESKMSKDALKNTSLIMVSIDPENDTPEVLKKYAAKEGIAREPYTLLRGDLESTRELANVLAVKHKQITPIIFSHSNIITIFDKDGVMVHQEEGTVKSDAIAKAVNELK